MPGSHKNIPKGAEAAHPLGYVQSADPGAIGADKPWQDTTDAAAGLYTSKTRDSTDAGWLLPNAEGLGGYPVDMSTPPNDGDRLVFDGASASWVPEPGTSLAGTEAALSPAFVALTDGATVTWATAGQRMNHATLTLGGNRTLDITGEVDGAQGVLIVTQDGTGSRTLSLPGVEVGGGITLTTTAGAVDVLAWICAGSTIYWTSGLAFA